MRRRKARRAAAHRARDLRRVDLLGGEVGSEAISPEFVMQASSVYSGQHCIGHLLPRGKAGVEAFDADDHSLGTFPTQKAAADVIVFAAAFCAFITAEFERLRTEPGVRDWLFDGVWGRA
jgi:hypothetical protein